MHRIGRAMLIWMTAAMLFMQTLCPVTLFGCCCQKFNAEENSQTHCCRLSQISPVSVVKQTSCCAQVTTSTTANEKQPVCRGKCRQSDSDCHCGRTNNTPALPDTNSGPLQEQQLLFEILAHPLAAPVTQTDHSEGSVCVSHSPTQPFKSVQILLCVSLL
ncbi:hypothetical protein [Gimesia fumaroli]|uniref:Uncharacterized protein n=1 Tax=Gimesia fumaroli TaxID=2527976 RepID=A0A518IGT6_9PLAN|nr:hypothetical protein [Gimesia fumaroli]QDV52304.1 hypothetical protein Enr17x_43640 [Gimesia fumaroli]